MASTDEKIFNGKDLETYSTLVKLKIEDVEELLPLVIKVTQNNNVITCDTSVADIYTEYTKHRIVVCDYDILGSQLPLTICSPSFVAFLFQYSTSIGYLVGTTDNNADTWIFDTFDILTEIIDLNTIRSGAALGATAYQKPSTGIPKSDLEQSVQTSLGKADTALLQHQDLSSYADGAEYDSTNHLIYLKHGSTRLSNPIDATDFIKDGMVDTVTVTGGNLVITFNTDSGKLPITIPISDIFDANNYYTKTESDNRYLIQHLVVNENPGGQMEPVDDIPFNTGRPVLYFDEGAELTKDDILLTLKGDVDILDPEIHAPVLFRWGRFDLPLKGWCFYSTYKQYNLVEDVVSFYKSHFRDYIRGNDGYDTIVIALKDKTDARWINNPSLFEDIPLLHSDIIETLRDTVLPIIRKYSTDDETLIYIPHGNSIKKHLGTRRNNLKARCHPLKFRWGISFINKSDLEYYHISEGINFDMSKLITNIVPFTIYYGYNLNGRSLFTVRTCAYK